MYNRGFIAHKLLCTASQDIGLLVKCKIPYLNCASRYSICKLMSLELFSLIAASLRSGWFPLFSLDIWFSQCCSRSVTYRQTHPIRPFRSKQDKRGVGRQLHRYHCESSFLILRRIYINEMTHTIYYIMLLTYCIEEMPVLKRHYKFVYCACSGLESELFQCEKEQFICVSVTHTDILKLH